MSLNDNFDGALESFKESHASGRLAHAYIVEGPVEEGIRFALEVVCHLVHERWGGGPEEESALLRVHHGAHPDVHWLRPESKSRVIKVDEIRKLNREIALTAMEGGWKAGIIVAADRLNPQSSNAFLKTLEEPPPQSILLLLTSKPQFLLPTIASRCQRIVLSRSAGLVEGPWLEAALSILEAAEGREGLDALAGAARWKGLMDEVKARSTEEEMEKPAAENETKEERDARIAARVKEVRAEILRVIAAWRRDLLFCTLGLPPERLHFASHAAVLRRQAAAWTPAEALRHLAGVDAMVWRFDRNMQDLPVFERDALEAAK